MTKLITRRTALVTAAGLATTTMMRTPLAWGADKPIVIGCSMPQTGGLAAIGKANLLIMKIWAEELNAKGGIMGRPVQFVYYDDQSNPANVPGIYTKLLDVDKVDLIITNGTNLTAPAMPVAMERGQMLLAMFALTVNEKFHYDRYFQTMPYRCYQDLAPINSVFLPVTRQQVFQSAPIYRLLPVLIPDT